MRKILTFIFLLVSAITFGQGGWLKPNSSYGTIQNGLAAQKGLLLPTGDTLPVKLGRTNIGMAALQYDSVAHKLYLFNPTDSTWSELTGAGGVTSSEVHDSMQQATLHRVVRNGNTLDGVNISGGTGPARITLDNTTDSIGIEIANLTRFITNIDGEWGWYHKEGADPMKAVMSLNQTGDLTINPATGTGYTFPAADGSNGTFLGTDGAGYVTWKYAAQSVDSTTMESMTPTGPTFVFNTTTQTIWYYNTADVSWHELANATGCNGVASFVRDVDSLRLTLVDATEFAVYAPSTWQQTLLGAGSTLTQDNLIDGAQHSLQFTNNAFFRIDAISVTGDTTLAVQFTPTGGQVSLTSTDLSTATQIQLTPGQLLLTGAQGDVLVNNLAGKTSLLSNNSEDLELSSGKDVLIGTTAMDWTISGEFRLNGAPGTAGQVLTSNAGSPPTWEDAGGSTPGIDDVLAVEQPLSTGRTIHANSNNLLIDSANSVQVIAYNFTTKDFAGNTTFDVNSFGDFTNRVNNGGTWFTNIEAGANNGTFRQTVNDGTTAITQILSDPSAFHLYTFDSAQTGNIERITVNGQVNETRVGINNNNPQTELDVIGNIGVTGNIVLNTAGNKLIIATGSDASIGTTQFSSGTITINTTAVTSNSLIFIQCTNLSNPGFTYIGTIIDGTSFVVNSTSILDASIFNWWIIN